MYLDFRIGKMENRGTNCVASARAHFQFSLYYLNLYRSKNVNDSFLFVWIGKIQRFVLIIFQDSSSPRNIFLLTEIIEIRFQFTQRFFSTSRDNRTRFQVHVYFFLRLETIELRFQFTQIFCFTSRDNRTKVLVHLDILLYVQRQQN